MTDQAAARTVDDGVARIAWRPGEPIDNVRREVARALVDHHRVEAHVDPHDADGQRTATWAGMQREGVMRGVSVSGEPEDRIVYARLASDRPVDEPGAFRALLNSFLPRKRAISQLLVRRTGGDQPRVLLCQLTYKTDWDLPGGVVEVGESPQTAVVREVAEELALELPAERLLLTDWLPPWGGWDDALCLVFDGGEHPASLLDGVVKQAREIRSAQFCTLEQVDERCADFTARRIRAALAAVDSGGSAYTESGRG
ncbi:NUDIX hydrolase [Nocardioides acrostichi]|uniref:NUDIX hydrolase n=1 Tax=Nocardioides acrostichi TaxID=2784339 RepID=A0A930UXI5_9ACTN|nr:NUDIX hydrolase [Nocardioides acrostichi]MBF4161951.1 NUDIX hydrolase [Nocardioides acrostichi]